MSYSYGGMKFFHSFWLFLMVAWSSSTLDNSETASSSAFLSQTAVRGDTDQGGQLVSASCKGKRGKGMLGCKNGTSDSEPEEAKSAADSVLVLQLYDLLGGRDQLPGRDQPEEGETKTAGDEQNEEGAQGVFVEERGEAGTADVLRILWSLTQVLDEALAAPTNRVDESIFPRAAIANEAEHVVPRQEQVLPRQEQVLVPRQDGFPAVLVLLEGLKGKMCTYETLSVMLEQASLEGTVLDTREQGEVSCQALLAFQSVFEAQRCVRHFHGRPWGRRIGASRCRRQIGASIFIRFVDDEQPAQEEDKRGRTEDAMQGTEVASAPGQNTEDAASAARHHRGRFPTCSRRRILSSS